MQQILIFKSLLCCIDLRYFKQWFLFENITGLYRPVAKIRLENLSLLQKLNSFNNATHDSFLCYCMDNQNLAETLVKLAVHNYCHFSLFRNWRCPGLYKNQVPCWVSLGRTVSTSTLIHFHDELKHRKRLQFLLWNGTSV